MHRDISRDRRASARRISRIRLAGALVGVALLGLSACGDDDDAAPSASTAAEAAAPTSAPPPGTGPRQPGAITEDTAPSSTTESTAPSSPPTTGDITETVAAAPQETLASVPIDESVDVGGQAEVEVASAERVEAEARLPGEVAGPAVAVRVRITNTGSTPIDLGAVTVNLSDAEGQPSAPLTSAPAAPLDGQLQPGDDAEGVYLFEFGADGAEPITIEITPTVDAPIAVFVGPIS